MQTNTGTSLATGAGGTLGNLSDLDGVVLEKDGLIEIEYSMEVSDPEGLFRVEGYEGEKFGNNLKTAWTNTKNDTKHENSQNVGISVIKPSVEKSLQAGATDDSQKWTITIKLGDLLKEGKTLNDILDGANPIVEKPGTGLVPVGTLSAGDFVETPQAAVSMWQPTRRS